MDLKALVAKAKAEVEEVKPVEVPVVVAGELVKIGFTPVQGSVWADLTSVHPPRPGSTRDANVGFNTDSLAKDYPLGHVTAGGEPVDAETWAGLFDVLAGPDIKNVAAVLWGMNQLEPQKRLQALGKASAGSSRKKQN